MVRTYKQDMMARQATYYVLGANDILKLLARLAEEPKAD
jgi:hypothetical protein